MRYSYQTGAKGFRRRYEIGYTSRVVKPLKPMAMVFGALVFGATVMIIPGRFSSPQVANAVPTAEVAPTAAVPSASESPRSFVTDQPVFSSDLNKWDPKGSGTYGIFVGDSTGAVHGQLNADVPFYSASIYKLYVAYIGYQAIDSGTVDADEQYIGGRTRLECLDAMIRISDNACAEKLTSELGKAAIVMKLKPYGITQTSIAGLTTTARDTARLLDLVQLGTDLSSESRLRLLESMKHQQYRNGIPKGMSTSTVYNKVGFRDRAEYADAALVALPDGRVVSVVIMTNVGGVTKIAQIAAQINTLLGQ